MPDIDEAGIVGKPNDISDVITNVQAHKYPLVSMIPKDTAEQIRGEYQVEEYVDEGYKGDAEGAGATRTGSSSKRAMLYDRQQKFTREYGLTMEAQAVKKAGVADEFSRQRNQAYPLLKRKMESKFCSNTESVVGAGLDGHETRGLFVWQQVAAQDADKDPVPDAYRPVAAQVIGSASGAAMATVVTEAAIKAFLQTTFGFTDVEQNYLMLCGIMLKGVLDDLQVWTPTKASNTLRQVYQFSKAAEDRRVVNCVDVMEYSGGVITLHPTNYLMRERDDGAKTDFSDRSGLMIVQEMLEVRYLINPYEIEFPPDGAGRHGWHQCMASLRHLNPKTGGAILCNS